MALAIRECTHRCREAAWCVQIHLLNRKHPRMPVLIRTADERRGWRETWLPGARTIDRVVCQEGTRGALILRQHHRAQEIPRKNEQVPRRPENACLFPKRWCACARLLGQHIRKGRLQGAMREL